MWGKGWCDKHRKTLNGDKNLAEKRKGKRGGNVTKNKIINKIK